MSQFDVHRLRGSAVYSLVVDVQADVHARLATHVVVPLAPRSRYVQPATNLTPVVAVGGEEYVVIVPLMAAVPRTSLGELVASLTVQRAALLGALDLLLTGS